MPRKLPSPPEGAKFGDWTFLAPGPTSRVWVCRCVCGAQKLVQASHLKAGRSRSCGCEMPGPVKHGQAVGGSESKEYRAWKNMKARCGSPKNDHYVRYGGRGITVDAVWLKSFEAFFEHVGKAPSLKHSLERLDNDKGYEPGNVVWATAAQQNRNKSTNAFLEVSGVRKTLEHWGQELGLDPSLISARVRRLGWSPERALTTPARADKRTAGQPLSVRLANRQKSRRKAKTCETCL